MVVAADVDPVAYVHVELETHDVLLAEGAASESFVDDDSRNLFQNAAEFAQLYPGVPRVPARYCAPRVEDGEVLEAIRRRIALRAGRAGPALPPLAGAITALSRNGVSGWVDEATTVCVFDNGVPLGVVVGGPDGFEMAVPGGLSPLVRHVVSLRGTDGREVAAAPAVLAAETTPLAALLSLPEAPAACPGCLDEAGLMRIRGWALGVDPAVPATLVIMDNGVAIARVVANRHREDLVAAGIGTGRHGFDLTVPGGLAAQQRHVIQVRREADGAEVAGSPAVLECRKATRTVNRRTASQ